MNLFTPCAVMRSQLPDTSVQTQKCVKYLLEWNHKKMSWNDSTWMKRSEEDAAECRAGRSCLRKPENILLIESLL